MSNPRCSCAKWITPNGVTIWTYCLVCRKEGGVEVTDRDDPVASTVTFACDDCGKLIHVHLDGRAGI